MQYRKEKSFRYCQLSFRHVTEMLICCDARVVSTATLTPVMILSDINAQVGRLFGAHLIHLDDSQLMCLSENETHMSFISNYYTRGICNYENPDL